MQRRLACWDLTGSDQRSLLSNYWSLLPSSRCWSHSFCRPSKRRVRQLAEPNVRTTCARLDSRCTIITLQTQSFRTDPPPAAQARQPMGTSGRHRFFRFLKRVHFTTSSIGPGTYGMPNTASLLKLPSPFSSAPADHEPPIRSSPIDSRLTTLILRPDFGTPHPWGRPSPTAAHYALQICSHPLLITGAARATILAPTKATGIPKGTV